MKKCFYDTTANYTANYTCSYDTTGNYKCSNHVIENFTETCPNHVIENCPNGLGKDGIYCLRSPPEYYKRLSGNYLNYQLIDPYTIERTTANIIQKPGCDCEKTI
jgi:hypothetical protein